MTITGMYGRENVNMIDLSTVSTAELHRELLRREGVTFYGIGPEGIAEIKTRSGGRVNFVEVSGPATIIINVD
jgi:hypothetical protein